MILNNYFKSPVIIADIMLDIYASFPENTKLPQVFFESKNLNQRMRSKSNILHFYAMEDGTNSFLVHQIRVQDIIVGFIIIFLENQYQYTISDGDSIIINYAANTLSIYFSHDDILNSDIEKRNLSFYLSLTRNFFAGKESEAQYLALQRKWPLPPFNLVSITLVLSNVNSNAVFRQLVWSIKSILSKSVMNYSIILKDKSIYCLTSNIDYEKLLKNLDVINKHIKDEYNLNTIITISKTLYTYNEISEADEDILPLLRIAKAKNLNLISARDHLLDMVLFDSDLNRHSKSFAEDILGNLERYDAENNTNLLHILQVLADNSGIQTRTARTLFMHRNTLLYQIRKIESLTGLDLSNGKDLFAAQLALKIRELAQID